LGEMFGPSGPAVASRQGAPSVQALSMRSLIFWLIGIVAPAHRVNSRATMSSQLYGHVSENLFLFSPVSFAASMRALRYARAVASAIRGLRPGLSERTFSS